MNSRVSGVLIVLGLLLISVSVSLAVYFYKETNKLKKEKAILEDTLSTSKEVIYRNKLVELYALKKARQEIAFKKFKNKAHALSFCAAVDFKKSNFPLNMAVVDWESGFNQYAYQKNPPECYDRGYYQIQEATFKSQYETFSRTGFLGKGTIYDGANNLLAGCGFLTGNLSYYGWNKGIEIYNVGDRNYRNGVRNGRYVKTISSLYERYLEEYKNLLNYYTSYYSDMLYSEGEIKD